MPKINSNRNRVQNSKSLRERRQGSAGMSREAIVRSKNRKRALLAKFGQER